MTVEIEIDEKMWAEAKTLAKDLNIDYNELFINTLRENLYRLKRERDRNATIAEKEKVHRESYEKFPQSIAETDEWEEVQDWGDE